MANRHLARALAMQSLYEWDFKNSMGKEKPMDDILFYNRKEFAGGLEDKGFVEELVNGVKKNFGAINETITKYAPCARWCAHRLQSHEILSREATAAWYARHISLSAVSFETVEIATMVC